MYIAISNSIISSSQMNGAAASGGGGGGFTNTYSLAFDGVDDFIGLGDAFTSLTAFSISAWFKSDDTSASNQAIVSSRVGSIGVSQGVDIFINNNQLYGRIYDNGATQIITSFTDTSSWHQVILTYNGTNIEMYLDGVSQGTSTGSYTNSSADWIIGKWNNGAFYFDGKIDEVAIWNSDQSSNIGSIYSASGAVDLTSLNPTAWYRMGDNGSYKSPQWLIPNNSNVANSRISNYSLQLDGVDDFINCGNITALNNAPNASWSFWMKPSATGLRYLFSAYQGSGPNQQIYFAKKGTGVSIRLRGQGYAGGTPVVFNESSQSWTLGSWYHIAVTFDGAESDNAQKVKVYVNGSALTNTSAGSAFTNLNTTTSDFHIASLYSSNEFAGNIDEFAIFNTTLSASDVNSLYGGGTPSTITGALAHWKMGEEATFSTNWTVPDQVGSNDGTSANMTIEDRVGDAPNSTSNALSYNMTESDRETDVPS